MRGALPPPCCIAMAIDLKTYLSLRVTAWSGTCLASLSAKLYENGIESFRLLHELGSGGFAEMVLEVLGGDTTPLATGDLSEIELLRLAALRGADDERRVRTGEPANGLEDVVEVLKRRRLTADASVGVPVLPPRVFGPGAVVFVVMLARAPAPRRRPTSRSVSSGWAAS